MNYGFFIVGGVIFATYMGLTFWNIFYSAKKQKEENYPNMKKNMGDKETAPSKEVPFTNDTKPTE
jgi:heme/copper-type cytochrome/quinol oxidase subunit 1